MEFIMKILAAAALCLLPYLAEAQVNNAVKFSGGLYVQRVPVNMMTLVRNSTGSMGRVGSVHYSHENDGLISYNNFTNPFGAASPTPNALYTNLSLLVLDLTVQDSTISYISLTNSAGKVIGQQNCSASNAGSVKCSELIVQVNDSKTCAVNATADGCLQGRFWLNFHRTTGQIFKRHKIRLAKLG